MRNLKRMKRKWFIYSVVGMILLGLGLSLLGEAILYKSKDDFSWFFWGTAALVTFNAGIGLIGEAIVLKVKLKI
jgi:hypothetical protein